MEIWNYLNANKMENINGELISNAESWRTPNKIDADYNSVIYYGDRIQNQLSLKNISGAGSSFNISSLTNILDAIDRVLSRKISFDALKLGLGYAFPKYTELIEDIRSCGQLSNKSSCESFIKNVLNFKNDVIDDNRGVQVHYLLGYVGSGKTTLLDYILSIIENVQNGDEIDNLDIKLSSMDAIVLHLEYDEISGEIYETEKDEVFWNDKLYGLMNEKLLQALLKNADIDICDDELQEAKKDARRYFSSNLIEKTNLILVFDGFDSLSANKIEKTNSNLALQAVTEYCKQLKTDYKNHGRNPKRGCKVIISLRKCTYDSLPQKMKISDRNSTCHFLAPASFEDVIDESINILRKSKYISGDVSPIKELIQGASNKVDLLYRTSNDFKCDIFDNNYRRQLRYIATYIIITALRTASTTHLDLKSSTSPYEQYIKELYHKIYSAPMDYHFDDIMVFGRNTSFNNHFSEQTHEVALGQGCGFTDNIFCYFPEAINDSKGNPKRKLTLKLRTLQLLNEQRLPDKDCQFAYLSIDNIHKKLNEIGINPEYTELENALDFLEKSLYIRSSKKGNNSKNSGNSETTLKERGIHFKCSNFGDMFIRKILTSFSYISAVCQNTCMPNSLADNIKYVHKHLSNNPTDRFITRNWALQIIPYMILFLRFIKTIEQHNDRDKNYHVHRKMIENCSVAVQKILQSPHNRLIPSDQKLLLKNCKKYASLFQ